MAEAEPLLKTRELAARLGVSVSTAKRWVDQGEIRGARTVGRHRLVTAAEADRFARERLDRPATAIAPATLPMARGVDGGLVADLVSSLVEGRPQEARSLILSARRGGASAATLGDNLIRPALLEIGDRWRHGGLAIHEERRGTMTVESTLRELIAEVSASRPLGGPLAMGAAPSGDPYTVAGLLIELALADAGWEVENLGADFPLASLAEAADRAGARLVWVTANTVAEPARFLHEFSELSGRLAAEGTAIIAGGRGLTAELRSSMAGVVFGDRVAHIEAFAQLLHRPPARRGG